MERQSDGMLPQLELERLAAEVRRLAGVCDDELPLAIDLAERVLGHGAVAYGSARLPARLDGRQIVVPQGHPDLNFAVAHELAHWALRELAAFRGDHAAGERAANALGAALVAPPHVVRRAHEHYGERLRTIARLFGLSQTAVVLRIAEVLEQERAVVTRTGNVLLRARQLDPAVVAHAAHARGRVVGLAKARLRGGIDEGRVAVRAR